MHFCGQRKKIKSDYNIVELTIVTVYEYLVVLSDSCCFLSELLHYSNMTLTFSALSI